MIRHWLAALFCAMIDQSAICNEERKGYHIAYGYNNRDVKHINWGFAIVNLIIAGIAMSCPLLAFFYIIGLLIFCTINKQQ